MSMIAGYLEQVQALLEAALDTQTGAMEAAAKCILACYRRNGMVYAFGTGHAHMLSEELFYRAGGLVRVCPMLDERMMLHLSASESTAFERRAGIATEILARYPVKPGDVLIVASNSGRNAAPVEMAVSARERGMTIIALTNLRHSQSEPPRNPYGKRLFEVADVVLDNGGSIGDAAMTLPGGNRVGPTSTVVGAAMLQAIVCRVADCAHQEGMTVDFFASSNVSGGDAINDAFIQANKDIIRHL